MPSDLVVEVCAVSSVEDHPSADRLSIVKVRGWQLVSAKLEDGSHRYSTGDLVVYVPPGAVIPPDLAESLGVTNYLSHKMDRHGNRVLVVRQVRLRGEPSYGLTIAPIENWVEGDEVAHHFGITKYEPQEKIQVGDIEQNHDLFHEYTKIVNVRNFDSTFNDLDVVATEKIHGTNVRIGYVDGMLMAGSHRFRRKMPPEEDISSNVYWYPYSLRGVRDMIGHFEVCAKKQAIIYGEVYGARIQSYDYGMKGSSLGFSAFDILVDGEFLSYQDFVSLCLRFEVQVAPLLYRGPYSLKAIKGICEGRKSLVGGTNVIEGVVVRPLQEGTDPRIGRLIGKYVSDGFLFSKHKEKEVDVI